MFSQDEGHKQKEQHLFPVPQKRPRQAEADRDGGEAAEEFSERHVAALLDRPFYLFPPAPPNPTCERTPQNRDQLRDYCRFSAAPTTKARIPPNHS